MSNPAVNLETLHTAIKAALVAQYPAATVDYYPRPGDTIKTPAIYFELDDIEPATGGGGTEQYPAELRFCAYCVLSYKQGNKLAVRAMAAALLAFLVNKTWGQPVSLPQVGGAAPDKFRAVNPPANISNEEYECWRVEWTHEAFLGSDVWEFEGGAPTEVNAGIFPDIGEDNAAKYVDVTEGR